MNADDQLALKTVIVTATGMIPKVGAILGAVVDFFWDTDDEDTIADQMNALIAGAKSEIHYTNAKATLDGHKVALDQYLRLCATNDPKAISETWMILQTSLLTDVPKFQIEGYEVELLLLFTQYSNIYLELLADGVRFGEQWGWEPSTQALYLSEFESSMQAYTEYISNTIATAAAATLANTPPDAHAVQPFRAVNDLKRQLAFNASDIAAMWPYLVPGPGPIPNPPYTRQVWGDPVGTADNTPPENISPPPPPAAPITGVRVFATNQAFYGLQIRYGDQVGPVQGTSPQGSELPPFGGPFTVAPENPIVAVSVAVGDHVTGLSFQFKDGTSTQVYGAGSNLAQLDNFGEEVNDIYIASLSAYYQLCVASLVVAYIPTPLVASLDTIRHLYVSGTGDDLESFLARLPESTASHDDVRTAAQSGDWESARLATQSRRQSAVPRIRSFS